MKRGLVEPGAWRRAASACLPRAPACARAAFLVSPDGFSIAAESARDNDYMQIGAVDAERALRQHRGLQHALAARLPVVAFPGDPATPDAVFPNNVFATARVGGESRLLIGRMRHPVRQREAERTDIPAFFRDVLGYRVLDLRHAPGVSELTGTLVIDRARRLGYAGLSPRCDLDGVEAMSRAFGLAATFAFELAAGEYHTNVVMSVLASRALVLCPEALAGGAVAEALLAHWGAAAIVLDAAEKAAFAGNCIALDPECVWMSERAADGLRAATRAAFERAGFRIAAVALDEIERAGGSLRCCVAEIY